MMRGKIAFAWMGALVFVSCTDAERTEPPSLIVKLAETEPVTNDDLGISVVIQSWGGSCIHLRATGAELLDPLSGTRADSLRLDAEADLRYVVAFPTDRSARLSVTLFEDSKAAASESLPGSCEGQVLLQRALVIPPDESADAAGTTGSTTTTASDSDSSTTG